MLGPIISALIEVIFGSLAAMYLPKPLLDVSNIASTERRK
jgi:hypothetical protein